MHAKRCLLASTRTRRSQPVLPAPLSARVFSLASSREHSAIHCCSRHLSSQKPYRETYVGSVGHHEDYQSMRELTQKFVERIPLGAVDGDMWLSAEDQLQFWASQSNPTSIRISFLLLERLAAEQSHHSEQSTLTSFLDRQLLDELILNWHDVWKASLSRPSRTGMISPPTLVHELDRICALSPTLELSGTALVRILFVTERLAKHRASIQDAVFAEELLDRMIDMAEGDESRSIAPFQPKTHCLNRVLSIWAACARPDRAHELLRRVHSTIPLSIISFNCLLAAYAKVGNGPAAECILQDLCREWELEMRRSQQDGIPPASPLPEQGKYLKPDLVSWNTTISAWAKSSGEDAGDRAQALLEYMCDPENVSGVQPDLKTLNTVLACWTRGNIAHGSLDRARDFLQQMKDMHAAGELQVAPDLFSYSLVLNACARAGQPMEAQDLFDEAYESFLDGQDQLRPTLSVLNTLLESWSRAGDLEQAYEVLKRIREFHDLGILHRGPDTISYNTMLAAIFKLSPDHLKAPIEADSLLSEMENDLQTKPDFYSYSMVLQTWLRIPGGKVRASCLARKALDHLLSGRFHKDIDARQLKAVTLAFCRAGEPAMAEDFLMELCAIAKNGRVPRPGLPVFGAVVSSWEKSNLPESAVRAENLVKGMERMHSEGFLLDGPDLLAYKALLFCWLKSSADGAALRAYQVVRKMHHMAVECDKVVPLDLSCYNRILMELVGAEATDEAAELLREMRSGSQRQNSTVKPNANSYNIVLSALCCKSPSPYLGKIESILREMNAFNYPVVAQVQSAVKEMKCSGESATTLERIKDSLCKMI